jgi:ribosomal protein S18 acetylase RimI-like enzyme
VQLSVREAVMADANDIAALRVAAAEDLTARYGKGFWSSHATEKAVLYAIKHGRVLVAEDGGRIVGTLTLSIHKPWAIDTAYFTKVKTPVYLTSMAIAPAQQKQGIGRAMLDAAVAAVRAWPGQAIRLDAFDADAGAGDFYAKAGYHEMGRVVFRQVPLIYYELPLPPRP